MLDRTTLLAQFEGDLEFLQKISGMFLEDSAVMMTGIRDSIQRSDSRALRDAAHKLKGTAATFHSSAVVEAAQRLETMADEGDVRWAANALDALEKGMETLEQDLLAIAVLSAA